MHAHSGFDHRHTPQMRERNTLDASHPIQPTGRFTQHSVKSFTGITGTFDETCIYAILTISADAIAVAIIKLELFGTLSSVK